MPTYTHLCLTFSLFSLLVPFSLHILVSNTSFPTRVLYQAPQSQLGYSFTLPWNAALLNSPDSNLCTYNTPIGNCPPSDSHQRTCTVLLASISGECMDSIWLCCIPSTTVLCTAMAV